MTTVLSVNSTGAFDNEDKDAARLAVNNDNLRRSASGLPLLPVDTANNIKASYLTVLSAQTTAHHIQNFADSQTVASLASNGLTQKQVDQLAYAAATRMNNGESFNSVLTALQTP